MAETTETSAASAATDSATGTTPTQQSPADTRSKANEPMLFGMLVKDVAIVLAALSLWAAADTWYESTQLWLAQVVAVGDAIMIGLLLSFLFHEWGHYFGAKAANASTTRVSPKGISLFRFKFNYDENDVRQFHWMTYGAHIFHWGLLLLLAITLPLDSLGRIALVSAIFGFIVFATFIEYHILKDTWAGEDPETRVQALSKKDLQQAYVVGTVAGLFAIAALS